MRRLALEEASKAHYLKAAKRAFNYLRAIGNLEGMAAVTPIFATDQARINQQVAVLEAVSSVLQPDSANPGTPRTRLLDAATAQARLEDAAKLIETNLPAVPGHPRIPREDIAKELRRIAAEIKGEGGAPTGLILPDASLKGALDLLLDDIKGAINLSLEAQVMPIINTYVR
jgi:hypothetical protein